MSERNRSIWQTLGFLAALLLPLIYAPLSLASEANLVLPDLNVEVMFGNSAVKGATLLYIGMGVGVLGILFGLFEFMRVKNLPVHKMMSDISHLIYETCKTYLLTQGKFLIALEILVGACIVYYFLVLSQFPVPKVLLILLWSVLGILGSFAVSWFGIRINTYANSRTAFASLQGRAYPVMDIPLRSGMSIGVVLICVELILLLTILLFVDRTSAGACFIGFAIGESLGASALRICGGIFTKIADIASDLMKIVFNIKEDDARNPGVIADCAGDNAGDSVGPTADGFETYGVTAVALITFIVLAIGTALDQSGNRVASEAGAFAQANLIIWIFVNCIVMVVTSVFAYWINSAISKAIYGNKDRFNFEAPLTMLVWVTSIISIAVTFGIAYFMLAPHEGAGAANAFAAANPSLWWRLASIISLGTLGAALIPELTRVFTSSNSRHVQEVVAASREGGASLNVLSGLVAGNYAAFWKGMAIAGLMLAAYQVSASPELAALTNGYNSVFAFGLLAFGFLSMAPVTIAVDSFGPVTDNAQSVFELSLIENAPNIKAEIQRDYGFTPDFYRGKELLETADSAGNTFKATAKPVLIGTAVIGATTMIFSIILMLNIKLDLVDPRVLLGLICGGAVIYWFSGASMQAVTTGAFRAVKYIKDNINLTTSESASVESSKEVVKICTLYAQKGMINIFAVVFSFTLSFAFFDVTFFTAYLVSIAAFGLFQALFMANAGGAWDNAKKVVEVDLKEKGTPLHAACVVGDTVGDPYKDTSSVALNPIIKFTTLFGLLAAEIAVNAQDIAMPVGIFFLLTGLFFVYRSFYGMRIGTEVETAPARTARPAGAK